MPTVLQFRRGTTSQNNSFTGAAGELSIDTDIDTIRVHDGSTAGGFALVNETASQTLTNKTLTSPAIASGLTNGSSNGTGNIGSSGGYFNTVFAKATSAQYADVAEKYVADQSYLPGTVLEIGGEYEVIQTSSIASNKIAGVVSTNPALIMNSTENSETAVTVALIGRIPCRVVGQISKGSLLCSSDVAGHAQALPAELYTPGVVIGKALEDHNTDGVGTIEIMVGRL